MAFESQIPVMVYDAPPRIALAVVRTLGRLGIRVYVVDDTVNGPAIYSRYCAGKFRCHIANRSKDEIIEIARKIGQKPILITGHDRTTVFIDENANSLRNSFTFQDQPKGVVSLLMDKRELYRKAESMGVPTAEIFFPESKEKLREFLKTVSFPIIAKAIRPWIGRMIGGTNIAITDEQVLELYDRMKPNLLLQNYIPASSENDDWIFAGYFNKNSDCLFSATGKKLRQFPFNGGITSLGVCIRNKVVEETATRFLKALGYHGIVDIDMRYDHRDGKYKLLDVNPRVGANFRLFVCDNGLDVVRALYLDLTGQQVAIGNLYYSSKWVDEYADVLSAISLIRRRNLTIKDLMESFRGTRESAYFAIDDPIPFPYAGLRIGYDMFKGTKMYKCFRK